MDNSAKKAAIDAIITKRDTLLAERAEIRRRQAELGTRDRQIDRELADCRAAARVFGAKIDFPTEEKGATDTWLHSLFEHHPVTIDLGEKVSAQRKAVADNTEKALEAIQQALLLRSEPRIRDIVLDRLKAAGENGSKAAPIQAYIENTYSKKIHDKTVGMTLYRLAQEGLVRRDGHTWFIVPETMNPGVAAPGSKKTAT